MINKYDSFIIIDNEDKEVECEILFTFESGEANKNYMVYTDYTPDEDGELNVYAAIYNPLLELEEQELQPIESDEEWDKLGRMIEEAQAEE